MSASEWYEHGSFPPNRSFGSSASMRAELQAIQAGLSDKLPDLSGNGNKLIGVNSAGTALEAKNTPFAPVFEDLAETGGAALIGTVYGPVPGLERTLQEVSDDLKFATQVTSATGVASEDTPAIQDLLDLGGAIYFPKPAGGYYAYNDTWVIPSNTTIVVELGTRFRQASGTNKPAFVNAAYAASWTDVSSGLTWPGAGSLELTIAWASHGRVAGDPVWLDASDQAQYNGVFTVISVTDANTIVVKLRREPTANPTGTVRIKAADQNIQIHNMEVDYNYAQNTSSTAGPNAHAAVLCGIRSLRVTEYRARNTKKFGLCLGALVDFKVHGSRGYDLRSDNVKLYGPSWDGEVLGVRGFASDDSLSLQCSEPAAFSAYRISRGDVLNVTTNVVMDAGEDGYGVQTSVYPTSWGAALIDEIRMVGYAGHSEGPAISIYDYEGTGGTIGAIHIELRGAKAKTMVAAGQSGSVSGTTAIARLDVTLGGQCECITDSDWLDVGAGVAVDELITRDTHINNTVTGGGNFLKWTGQIRRLTFKNLRYKVPGAYFVACYGSAKTVEAVDFEDSDIQVTGDLFRASGTNFSQNPTITVNGSLLKGANLFELNGDMTLAFNGARLSPSAKVALCYGGTIVVSAPGSTLLTGEWFDAVAGAFFSPKTFNIVANVGSAFISRAGGNMMITNSAQGTIPANAPIICDQTATTNSWHSIANPTVEKY